MESDDDFNVLNIQGNQFNWLDSIDWLYPLTNAQDEHKIDPNWIDDCFDHKSKFCLINRLSELTLGCSPPRKINTGTYTRQKKSPNKSHYNGNLANYFDEEDETEAERTFIIMDTSPQVRLSPARSTSQLASTTLTRPSINKVTGNDNYNNIPYPGVTNLSRKSTFRVRSNMFRCHSEEIFSQENNYHLTNANYNLESNHIIHNDHDHLANNKNNNVVISKTNSQPGLSSKIPAPKTNRLSLKPFGMRTGIPNSKDNWKKGCF